LSPAGQSVLHFFLLRIHNVTSLSFYFSLNMIAHVFRATVRGKRGERRGEKRKRRRIRGNEKGRENKNIREGRRRGKDGKGEGKAKTNKGCYSDRPWRQGASSPETARGAAHRHSGRLKPAGAGPTPLHPRNRSNALALKLKHC
jgi:hypothetical protein